MQKDIMSILAFIGTGLTWFNTEDLKVKWISGVFALVLLWIAFRKRESDDKTRKPMTYDEEMNEDMGKFNRRLHNAGVDSIVRNLAWEDEMVRRESERKNG